MLNIETILLIAFLASAVISIFSVFVYTPHIFKGITIIHSYTDIKKSWGKKDFFPIANLILFIFLFFSVFLFGVYYFM